MKAKPKRESTHTSDSTSQATRPLVPVDCWRSGAMGITAYVFEESETSIRESGLVPEWVTYPVEPGNGVAVPAHHIFSKLPETLTAPKRTVASHSGCARGVTWRFAFPAFFWPADGR